MESHSADPMTVVTVTTFCPLCCRECCCYRGRDTLSARCPVHGCVLHLALSDPMRIDRHHQQASEVRIDRRHPQVSEVNAPIAALLGVAGAAGVAAVLHAMILL